MAIDIKNTDTTNLLSILQREEEMIIKPFHPDTMEKNGAVECGKIVSRTNKILFNYQIGDKKHTSILSSILNHKIILFHPKTNQKIIELYCNRVPFLSKISSKQNVRCITSLFNSFQSIGYLQQKFALNKLRYNVYNTDYKHAVSLILRKNYLIKKIQHRVSEFEIINKNEISSIGRIYPFSTDLERSQYGQAIAIKLPQDMNVELKATLLISALILKSRIN
ncbi:unnamed protein product [Adineta steineri]|uniref:Uncharacterized protein n=1 Tax=Adineta steineri TaxID=433720 RepID=A0A819NQK0_9BILA|nr:unnamed protein product [Adineta steineri]CAF4001573.1 unnamed protein product [Adineta steineri]